MAAGDFDMEKNLYVVILSLALVSVISILFSSYWNEYIGHPMGPIIQFFLYAIVTAFAVIIISRSVTGALKNGLLRDFFVPLLMTLIFAYGVYFYINPAHLPQLFDSQSIISARVWTSQNIIGLFPS